MIAGGGAAMLGLASPKEETNDVQSVQERNAVVTESAQPGLPSRLQGGIWFRKQGTYQGSGR